MTESTRIAELLKTVQGWEAAFDTWVHRLGRQVPRADTRRRVIGYIQSLLGEMERRNSWQLAEYAGHATPYAFQHVLGRATWDVEGVRDEVRTSVYEHLRASDDALVIDETGFLKQGKHSAGVQRQYSGTAGRVENCQIGVFLGYTSAHGQSLIDRELYLPKEWLNDLERCDRAGIPTEVVFQTKPQLAEVMLRRAFDHGIQARWVVGDAVYGDNRRLRGFLEEREQGYVLAVSGKESIWRGMSQIAIRDLITQHLPPPAQWQRLSAGEGSQGPRLYDWAYLAITHPLQPGWERGVLLRRSLDPSPRITAYVVFVPVGTAVAALAMAAGRRWTIETCFRETKYQLGLDQYEVRSWTGWYRHMTLVLAAQAFLAALQRPSKKKREPRSRPCTGHDRTDGSRESALVTSFRTALWPATEPLPDGGLVLLAAPASVPGSVLSPPTPLPEESARRLTTVKLGRIVPCRVLGAKGGPATSHQKLPIRLPYKKGKNEVMRLNEVKSRPPPNFAVVKHSPDCPRLQDGGVAPDSCTQPLHPARQLYKFPDFPLVQG